MAERVPERRASPRVAAPGEVALVGQGRQAVGRLRDVSVTGIANPIEYDVHVVDCDGS